MTPSELKRLIETANPESKFFSKENMSFAGDTMKNYGVRKTVVDSYTDKNIECWELYRKKPVKNGLRASAFFEVETFRQVFRSR